MNPKIALPPTGRPRWLPSQAQADLDLLYLSWGYREYGTSPIAESQLAGWNYAVILKGAPILHFNRRTVELRAQEIVILPPGALTAWIDRPNARCEILVWLWHNAPIIEDLTAPQHPFYRANLSLPTCEKLKKIHATTRKIVSTPDRWAAYSLQEVRLALELTLSKDEPRVGAETQYRHQLAMSYLAQHPEIHDPASALSDYLQISASSVRRLFLQHGRKTAREINLQLRMKKAHEMLEHGMLVKEVSFILGYNHANDFTRAYGNFFGKPPTRNKLVRDRSE